MNKVKSKIKHFLHCCCFFVYTVITMYMLLTARLESPLEERTTNYKFVLITFGIIRLTVCVVSLIYSFASILGLLFYNSFENQVILTTSPVFAPFICFRTVTRGNFPNLVRQNVERNKESCLRMGMENFIFEVVTDKEMNLCKDNFVTQTVVPPSYSTKNGVLFKGRALQYAIEQNVCSLNDKDWIVHLDEETLLTDNSLRGILNFVTENKADLGQGLITYANENVVNWMTTILDFFRVADDMGRIRMQLKGFHTLAMDWKGSYLVCRVEVEKDVSFDLGPEASVAEDTSFGLVAASKGYRFDFVEGEMLEKSPFTLWDLILQRRRWIQGSYLVTRNPRIPLRNKILVVLNVYTIPLNIFLSVWPVQINVEFYVNIQIIYEIVLAIGFVSGSYFYLFGVMKSYSLTINYNAWIFLLCFVVVFPVLIISCIMFWIILILAIFSKKINFYIVQKEYNRDKNKRFPTVKIT